MTLTEHNPQIYPFILWVATDANDSLLESFEMEEDQFLVALNENAFSTVPTYHKETLRKGVLVFAQNKRSVTVKNCAHEGAHVADYACQTLGIKKLDFNELNEAHAYLTGWAASCIASGRRIYPCQ